MIPSMTNTELLGYKGLFSVTTVFAIVWRQSASNLGSIPLSLSRLSSCLKATGNAPKKVAKKAGFSCLPTPFRSPHVFKGCLRVSASVWGHIGTPAAIARAISLAQADWHKSGQSNGGLLCSLLDTASWTTKSAHAQAKIAVVQTLPTAPETVHCSHSACDTCQSSCMHKQGQKIGSWGVERCLTQKQLWKTNQRSRNDNST